MTNRVRADHCLRGYAMTPENSSWSIGNSGKPQRKCKACHNLRRRVAFKKDGSVAEQQKQEPGAKFDAGKPRLDLIAPEMLIGTADILAFGAEKYGARNWEKGMSWSRPFGALMRHMWAWWAGEKTDPETGKSHLWHAACCLMFLMAFEARSAGTDDRPSQNLP